MNNGIEPADDVLMLAYAGGDVPAFEQLYRRHRGPLYRFLMGQLRNPALADELFQDVWQRVIAAPAGWQPQAAFSTWLFRIAHNRLHDHWRAQRHCPNLPADAQARTAMPDQRASASRRTAPHPAASGPRHGLTMTARAPAAAVALTSELRDGLDQDRRLPPGLWLRHIRKHRFEGRGILTRASLRAFLQAHPDQPVPEDLQALLP